MSNFSITLGFRKKPFITFSIENFMAFHLCPVYFLRISRTFRDIHIYIQPLVVFTIKLRFSSHFPRQNVVLEENF